EAETLGSAGRLFSLAAVMVSEVELAAAEIVGAAGTRAWVACLAPHPVSKTRRQESSAARKKKFIFTTRKLGTRNKAWLVCAAGQSRVNCVVWFNNRFRALLNSAEAGLGRHFVPGTWGQRCGG